ncbi:MAG: hypothetical protein FWH56_01200 [Betaproteobacteria bacterium]|nr:hypothetical protein [Betaproteobacteria bacterium]
MKTLRESGWDVVYGPAGSGNIINRPDKTITIDSNSQDNPGEVVRLLAYERGHVQYFTALDVSSKTAYLNAIFRNEGAVIMKNIQIQREIMANGGPDIGLPGHPDNHAAYNAVYDQYLEDGNMAVACLAIGDIFAKDESPPIYPNQTYEDCFSRYYDEYYNDEHCDEH